MGERGEEGRGGGGGRGGVENFREGVLECSGVGVSSLVLGEWHYERICYIHVHVNCYINSKVKDVCTQSSQ